MIYELKDYKEFQKEPICLAVFNRKGGTGKSIASSSLAKTYANAGFKVLVIDDDPQQSLTNNCGINTSIEFTPIIGKKNISLIAKDYRERNETIKDYQLDDLFGKATPLELAHSEYTGYHDLIQNIFENLPITKADLEKAIITPTYRVPKYIGQKTLEEMSKAEFDEVPYGFDLIPSSEEVTDDELYFITGPKIAVPQSQVLKTIVNAIKRYCDYDIILIDCPPSLGIMSINAIVASDGVILVGMPDKQSLHSLAKTKMNFRDIKRLMPEHNGILGFVLNAVSPRNLVSPIMEYYIKNELNIRFFNNIIPQSTKAQQSATANMVFVDMDKKAEKIFEGLAAEILQAYYDNVAWETYRNGLYQQVYEQLKNDPKVIEKLKPSVNEQVQNTIETYKDRQFTENGREQLYNYFLDKELKDYIVEKYDNGELWEKRKNSLHYDIKKGVYTDE